MKMTTYFRPAMVNHTNWLGVSPTKTLGGKRLLVEAVAC